MVGNPEVICPGSGLIMGSRFPSSDWLVTAGAFIGQIERHYFRIACEGKQIVKLEPGYAYGQGISLSFRTFYLCFL
jgi:hypothetical protein